MRIVIDLQACQSGSRLGGIGRYSMALAKAIAANRGNHDLFIVVSELLPETEFDIRIELSELVEPNRVVSFTAPGPVATRDPSNATRGLMAELLREDFITRLQPDIVHIASLIEGWGDDVVCAVDDTPLSRKTAITWYDLIPHMEPQRYFQDEAVARHYYSKIRQLKRAALLMTISNHSRDEAIRELGLPDNRVINISSAANDFFRPVADKEARRSKLKAKFGIEAPFLLYTGSFDARKNQNALVQAFAQMQTAVRDRYQLVIAGNGSAEAYSRLRETAKAKHLPDRSLIFTGHTTDDDLLSLYNLAHLFVFPPIREGFGLPVIEAMSCGCPVIGSDCTSVPEAVGRADALFDPHDVYSIRHKMLEVLTDDAFRLSLVSHAAEHAKRFSWDRSARRALEAFEALHERQKNDPREWMHVSDLSASYRALTSSLGAVARHSVNAKSDLASVARSIARNEAKIGRAVGGAPEFPAPRIGWVSTWGGRCGIASYCRFLVESSPVPSVCVLADERELDTAIDSGPPAENQPVPIIRCWKISDDEALDALAAQVARNQLDAVVIQFNYGFYSPQALNAFVARQAGAGRTVVIICHSTNDPPVNVIRRNLADYEPGLRLCDRILVHSANDIRNLDRLNIRHNVSLFPHGIISAPAASERRTPRPSEFTIATYGFFLPHKGLLELLAAFTDLSIDDCELRLLMVNAEYSPEASGSLIATARQWVEEFELTGRVTIVTDYLSDDASLVLLNSADLVVFPYQETGESSSAAVRMGLASRRPVAVTPLAIFDDVSHLLLKFPGTGLEDLINGLRDFSSRIRGTRPDRETQEVLRASRQWCEERSFRRVSRHLHELINQLTAERTFLNRSKTAVNPNADRLKPSAV